MYISHAGGRVVKFHADGKTKKWQYQLSLLKLVENDYVSVQKSSSFFVVRNLTNVYINGKPSNTELLS
ncbi:MAG TPA: hypothetical protein ENF45_00810 [Bacteroidetes bacterium]|nr:hypothetical protein [Bacteroidota bacterium]